jgi:hypothetical protein
MKMLIDAKDGEERLRRLISRGMRLCTRPLASLSIKAVTQDAAALLRFAAAN